MGQSWDKERLAVFAGALARTLKVNVCHAYLALCGLPLCLQDWTTHYWMRLYKFPNPRALKVDSCSNYLETIALTLNAQTD